MARHLQAHIWTECAYTLECIKPGDWLWHSIMSVNKAKQTFFLQRVHFAFSVKRRQVRQATHARLNLEAWDLLFDTSCVLEEMRKARNEDGAALFDQDVLRCAMQKMLEGNLAQNQRC